MRAVFAALVVLLAQSLVPEGLAQAGVGAAPGLSPPVRTSPTQVETGTITYIDHASMNFVVQGNRAALRYWITRSTRFSGRGPNPSFFDLRRGQRVRVVFHGAGPLEIADDVAF